MASNIHTRTFRLVHATHQVELRCYVDAGTIRELARYAAEAAQLMRSAGAVEIKTKDLKLDWNRNGLFFWAHVKPRGGEGDWIDATIDHLQAAGWKLSRGT